MILLHFKCLSKTSINQAIRAYEVEKYPMDAEKLQMTTEINILRNEIFLDSERQLIKEIEKSIFIWRHQREVERVIFLSI